MTETKFNILVLGGGGREHACAGKLLAARCARCFVRRAMAARRRLPKTYLDEKDHDAVVAFCRENTIALVVIGPEAPLVDGLADTLQAHEIAAFGPGAAAQLEGSKGFTRIYAPKPIFRLPPMAALPRPNRRMTI